MLEMRIHGFGGQGAVTLAQLIATCALEAGKIGQSLPFFGTERRGSAVKACVRISDEEIKIRSQSVAADLLIIMNEKLLETGIESGTKPSAEIILNAVHPPKTAYPLWYLDATKIAIENELIISGVPFINIPMLGAVCKKVGISKEIVERVLRAKWTGSIGEKNVRAALAAYDAVQPFTAETV